MHAIWRRPGVADHSPDPASKPIAGVAGAALAAALLLHAGEARAAAAAAAGADDLARLSLEELAQVEIVSVSRNPEPLSDAAGAVFVITADDIRRSGAASLPEALRLAPNLDVARIDAMSWAITARGFNSRETSNKLLVMVDGRPIYTTLYSGVTWDSNDVPLEEIARIEVTSGPGGALYGANAVNGVINIITRRADDRLGPGVTVTAGDEDQRITARHAVRFGETGAARAYVTAFNTDGVHRLGGGDLNDDASGVQAGFRADWGAGDDRFTLQGDAYDRRADNRDLVTQDLDGFNLLARWEHAFSETASLSVAAFVDLAHRVDPALESTETTWDVSAQYRFRPHPRHDLTLGGGYRLVSSDYDIDPASPAFLLPASRDIKLANLFVHDRIALADGLALTLALKAEESSLSGLEWMPSLRLGWRANEQMFLWARASRAVRTPSRIDRDLTFPGFLENSRFESEHLWAYEVGYRGRPTANTDLTFVAFLHDYDDLRTVDTDPLTIFPLRFSNTARGQVYGIEAWGTWDVTDRWRLRAGAALLHKDLEPKPGSRDITAIASGGDDPAWRVQLRSQYDLTDDIELDFAVRAVDDLDRSGVSGYVAADARIGWRVSDNLELSLAGFNLFDDRHVESDDAGRRREIGRSAFVRLSWRR